VQEFRHVLAVLTSDTSDKRSGHTNS
jgi:hypothetical protein